jgi:hypothetical protein
MKKLSIIAILATLSLPLAGLAYGAEATAGVSGAAKGAAAGATVGADVDATTTASVNSDNYGTLISTLEAGKGLTDVSSITADANVTIVLLSKIKGGGDLKALDKALSKQADATTTLRASLSANAALKAKLDAEKISVDNVIAITTAADGMVTVYVDDRA